MIEVRASAKERLGMPPARFLRDFWQKKPLLIRGAFARSFAPLTPDDLAGLACEPAALSRIVVHEARRDRWKLRTGPFDPADFAKLPKRDWTLLVQDVDKWDADVATLLPQFAFLPRWRIDDVMVSYAVDGGSVGAHVDNYDVFLLQGLGRRSWRISTDPRASKATRDDAEIKLLRTFEPTHEWVLEAGDMLYLPPGVPHHGVAIGECMTYSVGMRAPSRAELLVDFAETFAAEWPDELRFGDPDLTPSNGDGEIDDAAIARVRAAMPWLQASRDVDVPTWFASFITRYRSALSAVPRTRKITDAELMRAVASNAEVVRNPWSRAAWIRAGRDARLFVAGTELPCSIGFARRIATGAAFPLADVATARDRDALRRLVDLGHVSLAKPARRSQR